MNNTNKSPNQMTKLLNKIERRLGLQVINLPPKINKDTWHTIIEEDTIPEFSRLFPNKIISIIDNRCMKDDYYFIDKDVPEGCTILGCGDIDWQSYRNCDPRFDKYGINFSTYDFISQDYSLDDIALSQVSADYISLFNLGIYPEFLQPNKVRLVSVNNSPVSRYRPFPLIVYIEHNKDLSTISPTMMSSFEKLAICDVAVSLYNDLKYFDGLDTAFGNLDLKLDKIQEYANMRDDVVEKLDAEHTSTANENQPCIICV